jgi:hypothetical protein
MKPKIVIFIALGLLLLLLGFMVGDFFFSRQNDKNPYPFEMDSLRGGDTTKAMYNETRQIAVSLSGAAAICTDADDNIYVGGDSIVEVFTSTGILHHSFKVDSPVTCIHVDSQTIYAGHGNRVQTYSLNGIPGSTWSSHDETSLFTSIAVAGDNVYVADAGKKVVLHFSNEGKLLSEIGMKDPAAGIPGFIIPSPYFDLVVSQSKYLWVVNPGRHSIEKYTLSGGYLNSWGEASMAVEGFCGCCNPTHLALLNDSLFVTSEKAIERIKIYQPNGKFLGLVATPQQFTEGTKGIDLAVDSHNRIIALDPQRKQLRVFEPVTPQSSR